MLRLLAWQSSDAPGPVGGAFSASLRDRFLADAMRFLGQPYLWGGGHGATFSKPGPVDCSGLVQQAARMAGFNLDGTADMQQSRGTPVPLTVAALRPGDLVFIGKPAEHVGIYIGNDRVLEAPHTGDVVKIVPMTGYGWTDARRYFDQNGATSVALPADRRVTPPRKPGPGGTYAVQPHDTLWAIAARTLGDASRWQEIYALNPQLSDPNLVFPGMVIRLPGPGVAPSTPTPIPLPAAPAAPASPAIAAVRQQAAQMAGHAAQAATRVAYASAYFLKQAAPGADARLRQIMQGMRGD